MTQTNLPAARAAFTDQAGRPTPQFYRFLESLSAAQGTYSSDADIAAINAQLAALQAEIDALPKDSAYPILQALAPIYSDGLLQNGFARLRWGGTTSDVPEGSNLYYTDDRVRAVLGRSVVAFAFGDASPAQIYVAPDNRLAVRARVVIDTPFNGTGAALTLGTSAQPDSMLATTDSDPATAGGYEAGPDVDLATGDIVQLFITPGTGATQGAGRIIFDAYER